VEGQPQPSEPARVAQKSKTSLFLALEGGGAKGIVHVAAWAALEPYVVGPERQFDLEEIAGTSAGAIAAAFIAAGAHPEQLIASDGSMPLAAVLGIKRFYDLFSVAGWRRLQRWRRILNPSGISLWLAWQMTGRLRKKQLKAEQPWREPLSKPSIIHNPMIIAVGFFVVLGICGTLVQVLLTKRPITAAIDFIIFWLLSFFAIQFSKSHLDKLERDGLRDNNRHIHDWPRFKFHPGVSICFAAAITAVLHQFIPRITIDTILAILSEIALYGVCTALIFITIHSYCRAFVKGTVRTPDIRKDLNRALVAILKMNAHESPLIKRRGLTSADKAALMQRLQIESDPQRPYQVTFRDIEIATGRRLNIVTADTIKNSVYVFSTATDGDFPVAKAVSASLAIPFLFRPIQSGRRYLVDGGIVSVIPAWVFRRHKARDPNARIIAVGIAPGPSDDWVPKFLTLRDTINARRRKTQFLDKSGPWKTKIEMAQTRFAMLWNWPIHSLYWPFRFMANVAYTSAYGARALELEAGDRLDTFPLATCFGLLDFDKTPSEIEQELTLLKVAAKAHIANILELRERVFRIVCSEIERRLWERAKSNDRKKEDGDRIRMFWAAREGRAESVRIKYDYGFENSDQDRRLVLPFWSSMTGWAADKKKSYFGDKSVLERMLLQDDMNRDRRALKWTGLKWCWAIPVKNKHNDLRGVFVIESNLELMEFDHELGTESKERSQRWFDNNNKNIHENGPAIAYNEKGVMTEFEEMLDFETECIDTIEKEFSGNKVMFPDPVVAPPIISLSWLKRINAWILRW
jgi:predicted acylesterase/phospholipase RssA